MLIDPSQRFFGALAGNLRTASKALYSQVSFSTLEFALVSNMSEAECRRVLVAMVEAGWLYALGHDQYRARAPFAELAYARIGSPLQREEADELLRGAIASIQKLNADPKTVEVVTRVAVFGAYLQPENEIEGLIDLVFWSALTTKLEDPRRGEFERYERMDTALINGSERIRTSYASALEDSGIAYQVLYEFDPITSIERVQLPAPRLRLLSKD